MATLSLSLEGPLDDQPINFIPGCLSILERVLEERRRQVARYGLNDDLEDGTGPETRWLLPVSGNSATIIERLFRDQYEEYEEETGKPTWVHLLREEAAEAFQEASGSERLEEELVQLAALCVSWLEVLQRRKY